MLTKEDTGTLLELLSDLPYHSNFPWQPNMGSMQLCIRSPQVARLWDVVSRWGKLESLVLRGICVPLADIPGAVCGGGWRLTELHLLGHVDHEDRCRP